LSLRILWRRLNPFLQNNLQKIDMEYSVAALVSVIIFALVHLYAEKMATLNLNFHRRFLSAGGGVAIAYVFIDLLPKISKSDSLVKEALWKVFPYFERHVYIMALLGFVLFFAIDRSQLSFLKQSTFFWLSLSCYALFNFLVGYAVVDKDNPEVQPLILFTFAMALHYFMNDFSLNQDHGEIYRQSGRWILIASLFFGWLAGVWIELSQTAVALVSAFIGGGVIMNVTRHELPAENPHSLGAFLTGTAAYTMILLAIGS
jgi:hypothetical protein